MDDSSGRFKSAAQRIGVTVTPSTVAQIMDAFNAHPEDSGSILLNIHRISDIYSRNKSMYPIVIALESQDDTVWAKLCNAGSNLQQTILDLVLQDAFCGVSKAQFLGSDFSAYHDYVSILSKLSARYLKFLHFALQTDPDSSFARQHADEALHRFSPLWKTMWELAPPGPYPLLYCIEKKFAQALRSQALLNGFNIIHLHDVLHGPLLAPKLDTFLIHHIMDAYCFFPPSIPREQFIVLFYRILDPPQTSLIWRSDLLESLIGTEAIAEAFLDVCCQAFSGNNLALNGSDHELMKGPTRQLVHLCHNALKDGPDILRRVASSPEMFQKLVRSMTLVCTRERCFGDPYCDYDEMSFACLQTTCILLKLAREVPLDIRTCYLLLNMTFASYVRWLDDPLKEAETVIDCLSTYLIPAAKIELSSVSAHVRKDLISSRHLLFQNALFLIEDLPIVAERSKALANKTRLFVSRLLHELDLDTQPPLPLQGRQHRCHFGPCECSGIKPLHQLRVCKGCWTALYCSRSCQELNWEEHKAACLVMREQEMRS